MKNKKELTKFLRSNVVPICLFPQRKNEYEYSVDFKVIGTGFNIATLGKGAILITASHLSEMFIDSFDPNRHDRSIFFPEAKDEDVFFGKNEALVFFNVGSNNCRKADINVTALSHYYDIGLIHAQFRHPKYEHLSQLAIDSKKLDIGHKVFIFSYSDLKYSTGAKFSALISNEPQDLEDIYFHKFDGDLETVHEGNIVEIHNDFRGCRYEVNIPVNSGMSGGLVFYIDTSGNPVACGVVSSSLADSNKSSKTSDGQGCFVTPINDILNIPLIDNGKHPQFGYYDKNGQIKDKVEIKTLQKLIELGVIVDKSSLTKA